MKIETNIPIPKRPRQYRLAKWLKKLNVEDSLFIPCKRSQHSKIRSNIGMTVKRHNQKIKNPIAVTTQGSDDGIRVWRTR